MAGCAFILDDPPPGHMDEATRCSCNAEGGPYCSAHAKIVYSAKPLDRRWRDGDAIYRSLRKLF